MQISFVSPLLTGVDVPYEKIAFFIKMNSVKNILMGRRFIMIVMICYDCYDRSFRTLLNRCAPGVYRTSKMAISFDSIPSLDN
jgi:hypothetical protein